MTEANNAKNGVWGSDHPIGVAVLGMGTVGTEVVRIIRDHADDLCNRVGAPVVLRGVAVRDLSKDRGLPADMLTTDAQALVTRDDVDIVVEVMGGIDPARALIAAALNSGKSVVTANKALLADYTGELAAAAENHRADLYFEAAVAGAIPVVRPLIQSLSGDRVNRVVGIVNGTTNFILSAMAETGADYDDVLAEATRLGYAEADPTADVEGYDAAAKAAILASVAFHTRVTSGDVYREGISKITSEDLETESAVG
ncbi:homoserine dehydrogenase, partial [Nocardia tengchongensis]|uniref:homoserine dehydrogenase n=1 Tax=Nocardia tengchongensis TaxID=2055889 RepID=UPI0036B98FB5